MYRRCEKWTNITKNRLISIMGKEMFNKQVRFHKRTWYGEYLVLLHNVDIILHPFPFGGSKTSLDAFIVGVFIFILQKPFVTYPQPYLKGRMAHSYYHTINLTELYNIIYIQNC